MADFISRMQTAEEEAEKQGRASEQRARLANKSSERESRDQSEFFGNLDQALAAIVRELEAVLKPGYHAPGYYALPQISDEEWQRRCQLVNFYERAIAGFEFMYLPAARRRQVVDVFRAVAAHSALAARAIGRP